MEESPRTKPALFTMFTMRHYYGDVVRELFIVAAVILFLAIPFAASLPFPITGGMVLITLIVTLFAGLTNPRQYWVAVADAVISGIGCILFEFVAILSYRIGGDPLSISFLILQVLAVDFLVAFYFSVKTIRGMQIVDSTPQKDEEPEPPDYTLYTR